MNRLVASLLLSAAASPRVQRPLAWIVDRALFLMGVGSGASPYASGEWGAIEALKRRAGDGALCVFDVGANQGQFLRMATYMLDAAGRAYRAHAFEPSRHAFATLRDHFGDHPRVALNAHGLGREAGVAPLYYDTPGSGLASLSRRKLEHFGIRFDQSEEVRIATLDEYCARNAIASIDLLKIDVEGHELDVLRGGARMIGEGRVGMVLFEFGGTNIDSRVWLRDFWEFFAARGMGPLHRVLPSGRLAALPGYRESDELFRVTNFVVFRAHGAAQPPASAGQREQG